MSDAAPSQVPDGPEPTPDRKAPGAFRTIGEVTKALGIRQHVLRYWEEQFPMLRPVKRSGGRRYYRPEDVHLIETIDRLVHREGYTLRGARQAIEAGGRRTTPEASAPAPSSPPRSADAGVTSRLRQIRAELAGALTE